MLTIEQLIKKFAHDIKAMAMADALDDVIRQLNKPPEDWTRASFSAPPKVAAKPAKKARRNAPVQLCPVPRCKHRAAPAFGMVCGDHRQVPKAQIKKFREARRAAAK